MSTISIQEIQRDPLEFLRRIEAGEALRVVRGEAVVAEVHPALPVTATPRPFGLAAGQFSVPADFDAPLPPDILKDFEGT